MYIYTYKHTHTHIYIYIYNTHPSNHICESEYMHYTYCTHPNIDITICTNNTHISYRHIDT